jgi:hypothetical protein
VECSTSWQKHVTEEIAHFTAAEKQRERERKGLGSLYPIQGNTLNDQLPSTRPHLLKVPPLPNGATI